MLILIACADLAVAAWLVKGWRRQVRHREFYVLVTTLLITMGGWLAVLGLS